MSLDNPFVFKHLKNKNCTSCGAPVKNCSIDGQHCNGEQFETVTFDCGCKLSYVPNFSRIEVKHACPKNELSIKIGKIKYTITQACIKQINKLYNTGTLKMDDKYQVEEAIIEAIDRLELKDE